MSAAPVGYVLKEHDKTELGQGKENREKGKSRKKHTCLTCVDIFGTNALNTVGNIQIHA